jgi:hypothetical protein
VTTTVSCANNTLLQTTIPWRQARLVRTGEVYQLHQLWVAVAFALGVFLAACAAAVSYMNFANNALARWALATNNDLWIKGAEFRLDKSWIDSIVASNQKVQERSMKRATLTYLAAMNLAILSALAWACGAFMLARSLMNTYT